MQEIKLSSIMDEISPQWEDVVLKQPLIAKTIVQTFDDWIAEPDKQTLPVPWPKLKYYFGGLRRKELTVLTGDTGHGKTTWGLNLIYHLAENHNEPVMVFSFEMGPVAVAKKFFQMKTWCFQDKAEAINHADTFRAWAKDLPVTVLDHKGYCDFKWVKMAIAWAAAHRDCAAVLIDHFHSFVRPGTKHDEIEFMAQELTLLADKLNLALLVLCHPAKLQGDKKERQIEMDDLKGSSGLKQYPDNVLAIHFDKKDKLTTLKIHKVRDDRYGQYMGEKINYKMDSNLLFMEGDDE